MHTQTQVYDEDLSTNDFFNAIQDYDGGEVFRKVVQEGWLICVPKMSALLKYSKKFNKDVKTKTKRFESDTAYSQNLIFRHILIPNHGLPDSHFNTLEGNGARIIGNKVCLVSQDAGKLNDPENKIYCIAYFIFLARLLLLLLLC